MNSERGNGRKYAVTAIAGLLVVSIVVALAVGGSGGSGTSNESNASSTTSTSIAADDTATDVTTPTVVVSTDPAVSATTVHDIVDDTPREELDPIPLDETGDFGTGVTAVVVDITAVDGEARLPGEIAGPALRVQVRLTNDTAETINLSGARIDVTYGADRTPGILLGQPDVVLFPPSLGPGKAAVAASVFVVPVEARELVQVAVWYTVDAPIVVFEGAAPVA